MPHLNRGRAKGKQLVAGPLCVSIHVDQNVDSILMNTICCLPIARNLKEKQLSSTFKGNFYIFQISRTHYYL